MKSTRTASRKWLSALALALVLFLALPAVLPAENPVSSVAQAASVRLNKTKATLFAGETLQLEVKNTSKTVKWSSSAKKIASVNKEGLVTAKKPGTATITAKVGKKKYTCKITVNKVLSADTTELTLVKGKTAKVKITFGIKDGNIKCSSSNKKVAGIKFGKRKGNTIPLTITAKGPGIATVTVSSDDTKDKVKIRVCVEGPKPGTMTGDIQDLFGATLAEANKLLANRLVKSTDGKFYCNDFMGVELDKKGKIFHLYVASGDKYSLFGVTPGMNFNAAIKILTSKTWGWIQYYEGDGGIYFVQTKYPDRYIFLTRHIGNTVEAIAYYKD